MLCTPPEAVSTACKAVEYILHLNKLIAENRSGEDKFLLSGWLTINYAFLRTEREGIEDLVHASTGQGSNSIEDEEASARRKYGFLLDLTNYWLRMFREKEKLHIVRANIEYSKLGNRWQAVKSLLYVIRNSVDRKTVYSSLLLFREIESRFEESSEEQQDEMDFNPQVRLKFESLSADFIKKILGFVSIYRNLWENLYQSNPSRKGLHQASIRVRDSLQDIERRYSELERVEK